MSASHSGQPGLGRVLLPLYANYHNTLSKAEAEMYMADIEYAMHKHPWRGILDQCFVTKRDAYENCNGFAPEFGHFAEWVLAAGYFQRGYALGYFPEARFHHYYTGNLDELKAFTRDFIVGEIRYFSALPGLPPARAVLWG